MLYHNSREGQPMLIEQMYSKIKAHNNKEEEFLINIRIHFLNKDQINSNLFFKIQTLTVKIKISMIPTYNRY